MKNLSKDEIRELLHIVGSPTLVATAAGCELRSMPLKWAYGQETPTSDEMERLCVLKELVEKIVESDGIKQARSWLVGPNCYGMTEAPTMVIRDGDFDEARVSAQNMISDNWR